MSALYTFPPAPVPEAIEWPGTPIGAGNVISRTKGGTATHDRTIDRIEGRRDGLVNAAVAHITKRAGAEPLFRHDVIIHGIRVRATTNSPHLFDFWVDNWHSPEEWAAATGQQPPRDPHVTVYALGGVADQQEAAYYSRRTDTIVFFNTAYYGQLKSWVLGAVGRVLAEEYGIHSIYGACVEARGRGVLFVGPTGTGKSTSSYRLMTFPLTRFHSDGWAHVRYAYPVDGGGRMHPMRVRLRDGQEVRGYKVFRWLEQHGAAHPEAAVTGLDLEHQERTVPLEALDLTGPVHAYAFTSGKMFYPRTTLVEQFPQLAMELLRSKLENVPDVSPADLAQHGAALDDLLEAIRRQGTEVPEALAAAPADANARRLLARLLAFDNARAMLDVSRVWPPGRVFTNPLEPMRLATVIVLRRNPQDPLVAERLSLAPFMDALLVGPTPERRREVAYNASRAVDDAEEQAYLAHLERDRGQDESLSAAFERRTDGPETLREEFELFRVMHQATGCFGLNTVLAADPVVKDRQEAVTLTMRIIARLVSEQPARLRLTLQDYRGFIAERPTMA